MANDSSLRDTNSVMFDLETQQGVAHVLTSIRASELTPAHKNEIRDLVFLYTNGGRDQSVRISLERKISEYKLQPLRKPEPELPPQTVVAPRPLFGASRPAPAFVAPKVVPVVEEVSQPVIQVTSIAEVPVVDTPASLPVVTETLEPVTSDVEVSERVSEPTSQRVAEPAEEPAYVAPAPVSIPVNQEVIVEPVSILESNPTPQVEKNDTPVEVMPPAQVPEIVRESAPIADVIEPEAPAAPLQSAEQYLQRIRDIKSMVNEKVGNPVNLVDINNQVGREYMSALLDAMKKLNSGTSAAPAMRRLEASFIEVEKAIEENRKHPIPDGVATPIVPVMPTAQPVSLEVEDTPPPLPVFQMNSVASEVAPILATVTEESVSQVVVEPMNQTTNDSPVNSPVVPQVPVTPEEKSAPIARTIPSSQEARWVAPTTPIKPAVSQTSKLPSLAEDEHKLRTPEELPLASSLETSSVSGDPLFTREVDNGLDQLLSEWSLFKKSGLFGTGPKGREHPLFKKVSNLQIPLLLAGRFEGATQEIKQSITDYMNGWRYEQGIVYQQGEIFEHYLRRVIRHILDLQKN